MRARLNQEPLTIAPLTNDDTQKRVEQTWLAVMQVIAPVDEQKLGQQLDILKSLEAVTRIGVLVSDSDGKKALSRLPLTSQVSFVLQGDLESPIVRHQLKQRLQSGEERVLVWKGEHLLPASLIRNYLDYHAKVAKGASVFTPGVHASIRTKPVALAWDAELLRAQSVSAYYKSALVYTGKRWARKLPAPVKSMLKRVATRPVPANGNGSVAGMTPANGGQPSNGATAQHGPKIYLGTIDDQVELLGKRAGEFYPFPSIVNLVLSNLCNLKCVMCPYHSPKYTDKSGFFSHNIYMSEQIFQSVAKEAGKHGSVLKMGQLEEVFVHPRLVPWISQAREYGVGLIHITTNGTLLTRERSEALIKGGLSQLYVSLDAATPETYRKIRGWNFKEDLFTKILRNVDDVLELRSKLGSDMKVYTSMILQEHATEEKEQFVELWKAKGIDGVIVYQLSEHEGGETKFDGKYFDATTPSNRHSCSSVFQECYVYPEGEVSMCCTTMILVPQIGLVSMGNVKDKPLSEIWLGRGYSSLRQRLIRNDIKNDKVCGDCDIWNASETKKEYHPDYTLEMNPTTAIYHFKR